MKALVPFATDILAMQTLRLVVCALGVLLLLFRFDRATDAGD